MKRPSLLLGAFACSLLVSLLTVTAEQPAQAQREAVHLGPCAPAPGWSLEAWAWTDTLLEADTQAALFDLGEAVEEHPLAVGHLIDAANERMLVGMDPDATDDELEKAQHLFEKTVGKTVAVHVRRACYDRPTMLSTYEDIVQHQTWTAGYGGRLPAMDVEPEPATGIVRVRLPAGRPGHRLGVRPAQVKVRGDRSHRGG